MPEMPADPRDRWIAPPERVAPVDTSAEVVLLTTMAYVGNDEALMWPTVLVRRSHTVASMAADAVLTTNRFMTSKGAWLHYSTNVGGSRSWTRPVIFTDLDGRTHAGWQEIREIGTWVLDDKGV